MHRDLVTFTLRVRLQMTRGALTRVLRHLEHRCTRLVDVELGSDSQARLAVLDVTVETRLSPATLARQIEKLYDVRNVEVVAAIEAVERPE
jgi:acetolactate synthase regulatory subunit